MWEQIRKNQRDSIILVIGMALLLFALGFAFGMLLVESIEGGWLGLGIALVLWVILTLVSYYQGDSIFLGIMGAREIEKKDNPVLYNVVEEMQIACGLAHRPRVFIMDELAPNAFATGRNMEHASVAVTVGMLELLDRNELQGVIAHELAHIRNRDVLFMMMIGVMLGTIVMLADVGRRALYHGGGRSRRRSSQGGGQIELILMLIAVILMILASLLANLIYCAVSRRREYMADACAAQYTRYPEALASALEKMSGAAGELPRANRAMAPMFILNPLGAETRGFTGLGHTHPPTDERIRILRGMAGAGFASYDQAFRHVTGRPVGVIPFSATSQEDIPIEAPPQDRRSPLERHRQNLDALWKTSHFIFLTCACQTKLKIPPVYAGQTIRCPYCTREHAVNAAEAS
jgi:heat shock protein HtpX